MGIQLTWYPIVGLDIGTISGGNSATSLLPAALQTPDSNEDSSEEYRIDQRNE